MDIAFDSNRLLYVADYSNNRIQRFSYGSPTGITLTGMTLSNPTAVFTTDTGFLYVLDFSNYRVLRWNNSQTVVVAGGQGSGTTLNKISTSYGLFVDPNHNVYISEYGNHRVSLWTNGNTTIGRLVNFRYRNHTRQKEMILYYFQIYFSR